MLMCFLLTWAKLLICLCIFVTKGIAGPVRRNGPETNINFLNYPPEPGFNLNEEDITKFHIWPTGNIPYYIDDFSFDKALRDRIRMFLGRVNSLTSLLFVEIPRPPEDDESRWVLFLNRQGLLDCADHSFEQFTNYGVQKVVLGYHCLNSDENLADIVLSVVGVPPQHNSPDRDKYVEVKENNILPDKLHLFKKLKDYEWLFHNVTYDYESAGHYGIYKYTSNGKVTIEKKRRDYNILGAPLSRFKENGFSSNDILKIAMLYNYIVRNRESTLPECKKLFAPGSKLSSSIIENTKLNIKQREKPDKYVGKTDKSDANEENYDDEKNTDNKSENNVNLEKSDTDNEDNDNNEKEENHKSFGNNGTKADKDYDSQDAECNEDYDDEVIDSVESSNTTTSILNNELITDNDIKLDTFNDHDEKSAEYDEEVGNKIVKSADNNITEINKKNKELIANDDNSEEEIVEEGNNEKHNDDTIESDSKTIDNIDISKNATISNSKLPLAYKKYTSLQKQKLLGQSDYETGDEGNKKYIHEKSF